MLGKNIARRLRGPLIALGSLLLACLVAETVARLWDLKPIFAITDYRGTVSNLYRVGLPVQFDSRIGWIPRPGFSGRENMWRTQVTILEDGIRSNDNRTSTLAGPPILAVGDSFTFGDEVSDHQTWPAILERLTGRQVINGGVFAYGIDQIFLRLQNLLPKYRPETVIFSFIPECITRAEYSTACGANKPYFVVEGGSLQLRGCPVTERTVEVGMLKKLLGHSYLVHSRMMKFNPTWWLRGGYQWNEQHRGTNGEEIGCLLMRELESITRSNGVKNVYVLIEYTASHNPNDQRVAPMLACVDTDWIHVIDLRPHLEEVRKNDWGRYRRMFRSHMTYSGNMFVAEQIAGKMPEWVRGEDLPTSRGQLAGMHPLPQGAVHAD